MPRRSTGFFLVIGNNVNVAVAAFTGNEAEREDCNEQ
jgi:hypothetical protein